MLQKNTKYTALEILLAAGIEQVTLPAESEGAEPKTYFRAEIFDKFSVNIGGISGISRPDHIILVSPGTEALTVSVAGETREVELAEEFPEEQQVSEGAQLALKGAGLLANPEAPAEEEQKVEVHVETDQPAG